MPVLINLLPEARVLKLKSQARKRLVTTLTIATITVTVATAAALILLIAYNQKTYAGNKSEIATRKKDIDSKRELEQTAATIQEHLASFDSLNKSRLAVSVLFCLLVKTIPPDVTVASFQVSNNNSVTVTGSTTSYKSVGIFTKALEDFNVSFKNLPELDRKPVFSNVKISQVSKDLNSNNLTYSMIFNVDQTILPKNKAGAICKL